MLGSGVLHGKVAEHLVRGKVDRPRCLRVYNTAVSPSQRAQDAPMSFSQLPQPIRDTTAVLLVNNPSAPGGKTTVYLMGVSHISKRSAQQVGELIAAVRPTVVMLELCKDRVGLLIDPDSPPPQIWHTRRVRFNGLPAHAGYPSAEDIIATLHTQPGNPITVGDIEADCTDLLSLGIFASVRPQVKPALPTEAPAFLLDDQHVRAVSPFAVIEFVVSERQLPSIEAFSVRLDASVDRPRLRALLASLPEDVAAAARDAAAAADTPVNEGDAAEADQGDVKEAAEATAPCSTVQLLMQARGSILDSCAEAGLDMSRVSVVFKGAESGRVEAFVHVALVPHHHVPPEGTPSLTGLEGSAVGGQGTGIVPFVPSRQMFSLTSTNLKVDISPFVNEALKGFGSAAGNGSAGAAPQDVPSWRRWSESDIEADEDADVDRKLQVGEQVLELASKLLTGSYARKQAAAGRKCGIEPGEAWRAALVAAASSGARAVVLGDVPTSVSGRRLTIRVATSALVRTLAIAATAVGAAWAQRTGQVPPEVVDYVPAAVTGVAALLVAPLLWPGLAIGSLAEKKGEAIEEAVALQEPIQGSNEPLALTGEDALLKWPGAMEPLIHQRDAVMAHVVERAARGELVAPTLLRDHAMGRLVFRYVMGGEASAAVLCPRGRGDGRVEEELQGVESVVAVVGTAHVRGMAQAFGTVESVQAVLGDDA